MNYKNFIFYLLAINDVNGPVKKSTCEPEGEESEEVSPVFVALPSLNWEGGERLVEVSLSALRALLLSAPYVDGGKFEETEAGQD